MSISLGTVRVYVKRARIKLGTGDGVTDVLEALRRGEIKVPGLMAVAA